MPSNKGALLPRSAALLGVLYGALSHSTAHPCATCQLLRPIPQRQRRSGCCELDSPREGASLSRVPSPASRVTTPASRFPTPAYRLPSPDPCTTQPTSRPPHLQPPLIPQSRRQYCASNRNTRPPP